MSAHWNKSSKVSATAPLPSPDNIIHEVPYRGRRIVCTDDKRLVGQLYPDSFGFTTDRGYVVLDEFDEIIFPIGMHWFYTPHDAACAIEMLDTILPTIKEEAPYETLSHAYHLMSRYRQMFWCTYTAILSIDRALAQAVQFEENPRDEIATILHNLRQRVREGVRP